MRRNVKMHRIGKRMNHQASWPSPGTPSKQAVAASQDRDQQLFDHFVLPDHDATDLLANAATGLDQAWRLLPHHLADSIGRRLNQSGTLGDEWEDNRERGGSGPLWSPTRLVPLACPESLHSLSAK